MHERIGAMLSWPCLDHPDGKLQRFPSMDLMMRVLLSGMYRRSGQRVQLQIRFQVQLPMLPGNWSFCL